MCVCVSVGCGLLCGFFIVITVWLLLIKVVGIPFAYHVDGVPFASLVDGIPFAYHVDGIPFASLVDGIPFAYHVVGIPFAFCVDGIPFASGFNWILLASWECLIWCFLIEVFLQVFVCLTD